MQTHAKHLPADERRAITVETVIELAAEQNPNDITTAAIAQRMGLTQGALFRHFPTKESILGAVMQWVAEHLLRRVDTAILNCTSPLEALEKVFAAHIEFVAQHPGVPRMLFGELQHAKDSAAKQMAKTLMQNYAKRIVHLLEKGKSAGEVSDEIDVTAAATVFIGTIQGLVMQSMLTGDIRRIKGRAEGAFAIYLRGIRKA